MNWESVSVMNGIRNHIEGLMCRLAFPADAKLDLLTAYDSIWQDSVACDKFVALLAEYEQSAQCDYKRMLADTAALAAPLAIHTYTVSLLLFLCMSKTLLERYRREKIDESIYYRSMADLGYKLEECRLVYGINGSFVASWFSGFFALTRFALGRLQFELIRTTEDFVVSGKKIPAGSNAINIHIPRTGTPLWHSEVLDAYEQAAAFFRDAFEDGKAIFICKSWLLDPWNRTVLKPESNLAQFCDDFEIVKSGVYDDYRELWRLFDCQYTGDVTKLPQNSSLRRAYADRVSRGEPIGWGLGMFLYSPVSD